MFESTMLAWTERAERVPVPIRLTAIGGSVAFAVGFDLATGPDVTMTLGYSLCVVGAAWTVSRGTGIAVAAITAVVGLLMRRTETELSDGILLLNAGLRFASYVLFAVLTAGMRRSVADLMSTARRDAMTGVLTRQSFLDELAVARRRAMQANGPLGVVYFDLDGLKAVNDRDGHAAGDLLIRTFVERVGRHLRATDVFGRLGGDEFALVIERAEPEVIDAVIGRVLDDPGLPDASCGVAVFDGDYPPAAQMLAGADRRMYRDKQLRKGKPPRVDI